MTTLTGAASRHTYAHPFPVVDGELQLGGIGLNRLALRAGQTPFYAYERSHIATRIATLRRHLPAEVRLHYAIKANPMPMLVQFISALTDGCDVASAGELKLALDAGVAPENIGFAGPGKREHELQCAIAAGVMLHVESAAEMARAANIGELLGIRPRIMLRINPPFELKFAGMKMGGGPRPFGIDAEQIPVLLRRIAALDLDFYGFHIFCGAQNLSADAICEVQQRSVQLALELCQHGKLPLRLLNLGGGLGVPYFPGEKALDLERLAEGLSVALASLRREQAATRVVLELGRYLVAEAGVYICRVLERKRSHGQVFLIVDGGLHQHLAAAGQFGQIIRKNFPVLIGNRMLDEASETITIAGPLCTPLDVLAERMLLPHAEVGDLVVVLQSGAYGLSASPTAFLGHPPPLELLL